MTQYYPIFLDLRDQACTIVGGGAVAERKVDALLQAGAQVRLISPEMTPALQALTNEGSIQAEQRPYRPGDLEGAALVIAATDDPETNAAIWREARQRGVLVNTVDDPAHCSFIVPSVIRRGDLTIAISTGGRSPSLARQIRREIEQVFPPEAAAYLDATVELRGRIREAVGNFADREKVWRDVMDRGLLDLLRKNDQSGAAALVDDAIRRIQSG